MEQTAKIYLDREVQKRNLVERQRQRLLYPFDGSLIRIDMTLLMWVRQHRDDFMTCMFTDVYDNPVIINPPDLEGFYTALRQRWQEVHNDWKNEADRLKKMRQASDL